MLEPVRGRDLCLSMRRGGGGGGSTPTPNLLENKNIYRYIALNNHKTIICPNAELSYVPT